MAYLCNIKIKPSDVSDSFYMPLAEIIFTIKSNKFKFKFNFKDYINPFSNKICAVTVKKNSCRHGNSKTDLFRDIADAFKVSVDIAKEIYNEVLTHLNHHIAVDPIAKIDFPSIEELMLFAHDHGFEDQSEFNFNFMIFCNEVEMHIRSKSIKSAIDLFTSYATNNETDEEYTFDYVQRLCKEYERVTLSPNLTEHRTGKPWIIQHETWDQGVLIFYFDTLRDAFDALPLPGTFSYEDESGNY